MPAVTRLGDYSVGEPKYNPTPSIESSQNVFVNGKGVVRVGDKYEPHSGPSHVGRHLSSGSSTVFVNGKNLGRVGDPISCGDSVRDGSNDVFCGG